MDDRRDQWQVSFVLDVSEVIENRSLKDSKTDGSVAGRICVGEKVDSPNDDLDVALKSRKAT